MSHSMRTPLGQVRGLGSAKEGVNHFIGQRVTALALIFLIPWFLYSLVGAARGGYDGAVAWVSSPLNAILILLATGAAFYHMRLGLQTVIEDYIAKSMTRQLLLILNSFFVIAVFAVSAFSVLKIAG